ncbi:MAG: type IV toxin-antitoxin system AbiEi family antitoxin domain-containing protein [Deltaproteobacteria bacterium]|nr:type IV toxin-antitoxin system AbiEi family antitoxin domain-containing protein [Deltaproteobacteria bacterium]
MRGIELLKIMKDLNKPFFTIADLEKITRLSRNSLYVTLKRWVANGVLERIAPGIYTAMMSNLSVEKIAAQLYIPNYISFESALARQGILNLIPHSLTLATTRKTKRYTLKMQDVEFRQISPVLFFGFEMKSGINIAVPEKAFLDQVYFFSRGRASLDLDELNLKSLSSRILKEYGKRFPVYVQRRVAEILKR